MKFSRKTGWLLGAIGAAIPFSVALASTVYIAGDQCCAEQTCNGNYERVCTTIPEGNCIGCAGGGQCVPWYQGVWVAL